MAGSRDPNLLDYSAPDGAPPPAFKLEPDEPRKLAIGCAGGLTLLIVFLLGTSAPFRTTRTQMDIVTGSTRETEFWPFGIASGSKVQPSPLETRMKSVGIAWRPTWQLLSDTDSSLFGIVTRRACGHAPPIYQLRSALPAMVPTWPDAEVRAFVQVMQSGTEPQQRDAVDRAEKVFFEHQR